MLFMLDTAFRRNMLLHILKSIYANVKLGSLLGFKGDGAAVLFYSLDRSSIDLDFDLLDDSRENYVFEQLQKILTEHGAIKESREKRYTLFFRFSYSDGAQNIKLEVNRRNFGSRYAVQSYLGIPMKVMIKEDMAAHKMVAMLERIGDANRDIFDVHFFLKHHWPINEAIIEKRTGLSTLQFLQKCIDALETLDNRGILSGLGELLDAKQKAWAKEKLIADTVFLLRVMLESLGKPV
jgi:predicted nucleotidyltransferase component of viral defense system